LLINFFGYPGYGSKACYINGKYLKDSLRQSYGLMLSRPWKWGSKWKSSFKSGIY